MDDYCHGKSRERETKDSMMALVVAVGLSIGVLMVLGWIVL